MKNGHTLITAIKQGRQAGGSNGRQGDDEGLSRA
jgi:hypothetical protein